ncbi:MAG: PEP-CTERM sorting domain-containing protein [Phycisphaerae bacterium]|nr:PEP-CTERM sorting domain-containing protein [Phycisphaerae bacterium]
MNPSTKKTMLAAVMNVSTKKTMLAAVMIVALVATAAQATTIQSIMDGGGSVTVGHFTFSDFTVQATAIGGVSPLADLIDIDISVGEDGGVTLSFHGAWSAGPLDWSVITSNISYKVSVDEEFIAETSDMAAISSSLLGDAFYLMNVGVFDGDPADPDSELMAEHLLQEGLGEDVTGDSQEFENPLQEFYVNMGLYLRTEEDGAMVVLSEFAQTFGGTAVTTPEPTALALLAMGGAGICLKRFR